MNSPHIDTLVEQINNSKTREYFSEVLSSFYSGNYRSAIVMLYTCVICDLVYKIKEMKEYYKDRVSEDILDKISAIQAQNPKSPEWEKVLVDEMFKKHRIIEVPEYTNIESLQHHRNLCAHPILNEGAELYHPNRFTVQAHIVNMLEGVLCKSSMISAKLFDSFIKDLSKVKEIFVLENDISRYITSKYLNKINNIEIEFQFFKRLWKFIFKLQNEECENNRIINYSALKIIFKRHKTEFTKRIELDCDYFGQNINLENENGIELLIYLLNEYPKIFNLLPNENRVSMSAYIDRAEELKNISLFKIQDIKKHIFSIGSTNHKIVQYLYNYLLDSYGPDNARDFYIYQFAKSTSFNCADFRFEKYIHPYINDFSEEQLLAIIKAINSNSQIYSRNLAKSTNSIVVDKIRSINPEFNIEQYTHVYL
ncbi:MAG: hypothetical protein IJ436_00935 [Bacteroidaceae bacterium]|nr:hypothetical protein [Bacteroidaceae bacterium]